MKLFFHAPRSVFAAVLVFLVGRASTAFANPTGLTVSTGNATAQQIGSQLNVTASQFAILNWQSFNIQKGETTAFLQPSSSSIVFNVIGGANPSQIFGSLHASGTVILANANGFYFGPDSMIKVGGSFIATTTALPPDLGSGAGWQFSGTPPLASIVNYGQIEVGTGKSLYLIAEKIENHGTLSAPQGDAELLAGDDVLVSERPDGRGLSATLKLPTGSVDNFGRITADAGTIALQAKVVNQNGILQADSIAEKNGVIELVAADSLTLGADSQILARGDDAPAGSAGGNITLKSANVFSDADGSSIITTGGAKGGDGGDVEVSAAKILSLNSAMDSRAVTGSKGGHLLLDPIDIVLNNTGDTTMLPVNGTIDGSDANVTDTWSVNVTTAFKNKNFSEILLAASGNISLSSGLNWDLSGSTGLPVGQLTLEAAGDIIFGDKSKITDANNWNVSLYAGYNFADHSLKSTGSIYLNGGSGQTGNGSIQLAAGNINLFAGDSILVAPMVPPDSGPVVSGSIFTTGGGNIFAYAQKGDINAGTSNGGKTANGQDGDYNFADDGYSPYPFLGGISTAAGGNVTLIAGRNIDSTPIVATKKVPGASGAYGAGDVTIIAGQQITGNYTLAYGTGTLLAGVTTSASQAAALQNPAGDPAAYAAALVALKQSVIQLHDANGNIGAPPVGDIVSAAPVTLGLVAGSWNAWAGNDISIKQVLNPNGAFNTLQSFQYDYDANAAANFWAGNAIELVGGSYGAAPSSVKQTPIYAPTLSLNAGAGGIKIDKSIILAPSSAGSLSIITRDGGNLIGAPTANSITVNGITMSDSAVNVYTTFSAEHDNIHQNDPNVQNDPLFRPVYLDISGSIGTFSLTVPTFADITVEGTQPFVKSDGTSIYGTYNFGFHGRNVLPGQTTSINVLKTVSYRGDLTSINLTSDQLADPLPPELFTDSANTFITSKLKFDATTGKLIFIGVMKPEYLAFLENPSVLVLDKNGQPILIPALDGDGNVITDENGDPTYVPKTKPLVLDATQQGMIAQLALLTVDASLGDQGFTLAGPGHFNVSANTMDLGVSGGIRVLAPDDSIAAISPLGADLNVTTIGDLTMTSTKISNESYRGGVKVQVGGALDVGGQFTTLGDPDTPKGIFSTGSGDVSVTAHGDVNVNGSRIAAYDGGNVAVTSETGDVNAGNGGAGYVNLKAYEIDPVSGLLNGISGAIPGSGILATTIIGTHALLGDITINAPQGNVNASLGGVLQIAFNGADTKNNFIQINAGKDINASGSGIIGSNIKLQAVGDINGVVIGSQSININSQHNVNVTAVSGGNVDIGAAGSVVGTIIGGGDVSVSGDSIGATVEGGTVATSGDTSGASIGVPASNVAKDIAETADNANTAGKTGTDETDDELLKKKKGISLAQKVSRVTVILPKKD